MPVARLRLRPAHRPAARRLRRRGARPTPSRSGTTASTSACPSGPTAGRTVADVLVETLVAHGVTQVFGMVGHSNLGFADALRRAEERGELRFVGIRHEGAAAFAASAYGKLTGRPAACFAIAGPGSTNLLTGLYDAKLDQSPVIADLGPGALEGARAAAPSRTSTCPRCSGTSRSRTTTVQRGSDHAELAALAVKHARRRARRRPPRPARRGAGAAVGRRRRRRRPAGYSDRLMRPDDAALDRAAKLVVDARRPVLDRRARRTRRATARSPRWPSGCTRRCSPRSRPRGWCPDTHPLGAGVLGRSGTPVASWLMNESDLLIVVGASFSNHTGIAPYKPIVQIDDNPACDRAVRRGRPRACSATPPSCVGAADRRRRRRRPPTTSGRRRRALGDLAGREGTPGRGRPGPGGLGGRGVRRALASTCPRTRSWPWTSATTPTPWAATSSPKGQPVLMSGYLGSIGFGYPAAIGAWAADPEPARRGRHRRRRLRAVRHGADHGGQVRHPDQARAARTTTRSARSARSSSPPTTRSGTPPCATPTGRRYAELCGATGIRVDRPRPARRRDDRAVRRRRAGPALRRAGRRAALTPSRTRPTTTGGVPMTEPRRAQPTAEPATTTCGPCSSTAP